MQIIIKNPKCIYCNGKPDFGNFRQGFRCLVCKKIMSNLHLAGLIWDRSLYRIEIIEHCCKEMRLESEGKEPAITVNLVEENLIWRVEGEHGWALDEIKYCPFCGEKLPKTYIDMRK